ncbi:MAG TPA: V-type ATP synthase subunit E family protein [Thermoanaerobaculia bacterium]
MKTLGSPASVADAVREEASREVERLLRDTDEEIVRLRSEAQSGDVTPPDRPARLAAARREVSARLAREDWEDRRAALEERERWTERAIRLARERLDGDREAASRRELLLALAVEAAERLPAGAVEISVSASDASIADDAFVEELARRARRTVARARGDLPQSGCVVSTVGGKVRFDNSLEARARRFEPLWRAALTEIYGP